MAKKTTELPIKTADLSTVDQLIFVDSGDTTDSPEGTDKRVAATRMALTDGLEARITGGGTVSLGGFSLSVAKDGTAATTDDLTTSLADKADTTYVDSQDALKADITYVDSGLALKDDITDVDAKLALKQDTLTSTITGTGTIDTGTAGSLSLGEAVLTTGDKTGVIATEDDLASSGSTPTEFYVSSSHTSTGTGVSTAANHCGAFVWRDSLKPNPTDVIYFNVYQNNEDSGSSTNTRISTQAGSTVPGSELESVGTSYSPNKSTGPISLTDGTVYYVIHRTRTSLNDSFLLSAWLSFEAAP